MKDKSNFKAMVDRLARVTKFNTFSGILREKMIEEYKRKYKNYPRFRRMLNIAWKRYKTNQVAKFIKDNHEKIFYTWFCKMFYFDESRLKILDPDTRSDVDFNAKFQYFYTRDEIEYIEHVIKKYDISNVQPLVILNQLILIGLRLLGPIIQEYFTRPYDFQPENVEREESDGGITIKIFFSSREA
ncbi:MAG: hypothetical protein ACTSVI_13760 [Promethearchaeota archaeon]